MLLLLVFLRNADRWVARYIFGGHVAEYMENLADDDEERYKSQFQKYIDDDIEGEFPSPPAPRPPLFDGAGGTADFS